MILILNSGSSSIKYKLFCLDTLCLIAGGIIEEVKDFHRAFDEIFQQLLTKAFIKSVEDIKVFGHRVVHGGEQFHEAVVIDEVVIATIESLIPLAPLHNPSNLDGIKTVQAKLPHALQIAVFDTAFHQTMPKSFYIYPIPYAWYANYGIRRYGFHGISHFYIAKETANYLGKPLEELNLITIHLGNGDSITAIKNGKSIDTSMGFTPLEGLMMGTRSGDIDPEIVFYLENQIGLNGTDIDRMLNKESGFKGICNESDLRIIVDHANHGDTYAQLAIEMFCIRVKKYIGAYKEVLESVDAIVFTGGIGEHSALIRQKILKMIDKEKNQAVNGFAEIQDENAPYKILVVPTNE
ncbi:MAG: acetate kinase, partial [Sulfurovum sp. FS06-10]